MFRSKSYDRGAAGYNCLQRNSRGWTRTSDKTVNSRLLYQLSYAGSSYRVVGRQKYSTSEPGGVKDLRGARRWIWKCPLPRAGAVGSTPCRSQLLGDQDDKRRCREESAEQGPPEGDRLSRLGALGSRHIEPITRLDEQLEDGRAYLEGTHVDHCRHAVAYEANLAGIGRSAANGYVDLG